MADKYEILKPIGRGKFAVVYRAKRVADGQVVALKKISVDSMDHKAREKCLKEVRLLQSLEHPNIIRYLDSTIVANELLIVFEWAAAGDLKRQIRKAVERGAPLEERLIWKYFGGICEALNHMHDRRILHRDLKPANVFLTLNGTVKVGDLGLGRAFSDQTFEAHSKVGTPLYMSPEVLRGDGYDWKSDVWSLGCILYELALLKSPFKAEGLNLYSLFQKISKGDFAPLPESYSPTLRALAVRMLSVDPDHRPTVKEARDVAGQRRRETSGPSHQHHQPPARKEELAASAANRGGHERSRPDADENHAETAAPTTAEGSRSRRPPSDVTTKTSDYGLVDASAAIVAALRVLGFFEGGSSSSSSSYYQTHFALEGAGRGVPRPTQFDDFRSAALFLLRAAGGDEGAEDEEAAAMRIRRDAPPVAVRALLTAAAKMKATVSVRPHDLLAGFGQGVCDLLTALVDAALDRSPPEAPRYDDGDGDDDDDDDDGDYDGGESVVSDEADDSGGGEKELLFFDDGGGAAKTKDLSSKEALFFEAPELSFLWPAANDSTAWELEVERVGPRLRRRPADFWSDWRSRLATARAAVAARESVLFGGGGSGLPRSGSGLLLRRRPPLFLVVGRVGAATAASAAAVRKGEGGGALPSGEWSDRRREAAAELAAVETREAALVGALARRREAAEALDAALGDAADAVRAKVDKDHPGALADLRKASRVLRRESAALDVRLGVLLAANLSRARRAQRTITDSRGGATTADSASSDDETSSGIFVV